MGWVALGVLAVATLAALVFAGRLPRSLWQVAAAAIVLAMAGYALQGRPDLPDAPAKPISAKGDTAAALIEMRGKMDQHFSAARKWLIPADSFARSGQFRTADSFIRSGLHEDPNSADLWVAQGVLIMLSSNGEISPPAKLAFDKARAARPSNHPGPDYYEGLAELFQGRVGPALDKWRAVLARAPESADWKPMLESQIAGIEALSAQMNRSPEKQQATN